MYHKSKIESLYDLVTGDEDTRVCKDIPDAACNDQPRNFFAYLTANVLNKIADEIASAKLVLPWLLGVLGVPAAFTGFLVPIREAGVLLPQLLVAAYIRHVAVRKWVWVLGAGLSALALVAMGLTALSLDGAAAGWAIIGALVVFSLARGICSVSAKDVLGKTVSKSRRGNLMGLATGIAGLATLGVGVALTLLRDADLGPALIAGLILLAALLWVPAIAAFILIREQPGATEGGGNALAEALRSLALLKTDAAFRHFVIARTLLLSVALAPPFYVLLAQQHTGGLADLGMLVIAGGIAGSISAPVWGRMGDRSSRRVMALASFMAGLLGVATAALAWLDSPLLDHGLVHAAIFLLLTVAHSGVRLGRKVYLVDMATQATRAAMVAVSNTVIGVAMLAAGLIGVLGDVLGTAAVILVLALASFVATLYAMNLAEVSEG